jgi:hypothetical protein
MRLTWKNLDLEGGMPVTRYTWREADDAAETLEPCECATSHALESALAEAHHSPRRGSSSRRNLPPRRGSSSDFTACGRLGFGDRIYGCCRDFSSSSAEAAPSPIIPRGRAWRSMATRSRLNFADRVVSIDNRSSCVYMRVCGLISRARPGDRT